MSDLYSRRLERLAVRQREAGVDCVILIPGPNLRYLCGLTFSTSERPVVAFFPLHKPAAVLLPYFEQGRAQGMLGHQVDLYPYTDEEGYRGAFRRVVEALNLDSTCCAVEYLHMRVLELRALQDAAPAARFVSLEEKLPGLRILKDDHEIAAMREAIVMTEEALRRLIARPLAGMSERWIAACLAQEMKDLGADAVAFMIVVSGPRTADPHAEPSDRQVQAGDLITIDCGVLKDGYMSDITRTFAVQHVAPRLAEIYQVVRRANEAGKAAVKPGVQAQDVDRAARGVIEQAGYGAYFTHRTGHGLGIEVHEPPYIVQGNEQRLEPGMVFTVEPGIYIPGVGGVRIEDNVVVTTAGVECLTTFERELMVLA